MMMEYYDEIIYLGRSLATVMEKHTFTWKEKWDIKVQHVKKISESQLCTRTWTDCELRRWPTLRVRTIGSKGVKRDCLWLDFLKQNAGASLVAQWLGIRLPMQGTRVRALTWEDPTCCGAAKPMCRNYWACALEAASHNYWARVPQLRKPACLEPVLRNKRSHDNEKPAHRNKE